MKTYTFKSSKGPFIFTNFILVYYRKIPQLKYLAKKCNQISSYLFRYDDLSHNNDMNSHVATHRSEGLESSRICNYCFETFNIEEMGNHMIKNHKVRVIASIGAATARPASLYKIVCFMFTQ